MVTAFLDQLAALAEAAAATHHPEVVPWDHATRTAVDGPESVVAFIAACDPQTVLALVDIAKAAETT